MTLTPSRKTAVPEPLTQDEQIASLGRYGYGWSDSDAAGASAQRGLSRGGRPRHLGQEERAGVDARHPAQGAARSSARSRCRTGAPTSTGIDFDNIKYFVRSTEKQAATWDDLPDDIKNTYDRLGIPEAEKQRLVSGVAAQYESEVVYH